MYENYILSLKNANNETCTQFNRNCRVPQLLLPSRNRPIPRAVKSYICPLWTAVLSTWKFKRVLLLFHSSLLGRLVENCRRTKDVKVFFSRPTLQHAREREGEEGKKAPGRSRCLWRRKRVKENETRGHKSRPLIALENMFKLFFPFGFIGLFSRTFKYVCQKGDPD